STEPVSRLRHWCSSEYLRISPLHSEFHSPLSDSRPAVLKAVPGLSPGISPLTDQSAYVRFTPSNSEQRYPPASDGGCCHKVSRGSFSAQRDYRPRWTRCTTRGPSSLTRHGWIRLAPTVQYCPLLPPVGVWSVSQSQCG